MTASGPVNSVDARGIHLSVDLLESVAAGLDEVAVGDAVAVVADNFGPIDTDLRSWSQVTGHEVASATPSDGAMRYVIVKGPPLPMVHKLAAVVSSSEPDELAWPIGLSRAAALEGLEVSVFFRGDGVRVLSRFYQPRRSFGDVLRRRKQPHPHGDVFRLFDHGAHIYACALSMEEHGITPADLLFDNIVVAEYATMMAVITESDIHLAG